MRYNRIASLLMAAAIASSLMAPTFAMEYDFSAERPGGAFYQATTVGTDAAADSGTIIVGADGTIGTDESNMPSSSPLSVLTEGTAGNVVVPTVFHLPDGVDAN